MTTAIIKCVLPGLTGYAAGDLRLALRLHSAAQDGAVVASNLSLTPDAVFDDTYWATMDAAAFAVAALCDARITEASTVRGYGYVLMDNTAGVHVVVGQPSIASIDGTELNTDIDISDVTLVINATSTELATIDATGKLTIHRGDYTTFQLTLGNLAGRTGKKLIFTIKPMKDDLSDDSQAYLQITEVDGAVLLNGTGDGVEPTDASMTVENEVTGVTTFVIKSAITDALPGKTGCWYDVQMIDSLGQPRTKTEDRVDINRDVTRRSS